MRKKKIGYLAPEGTFSHEAAFRWGGKNVKLIGYPSFKALVNALIMGEVDEIVAPVENMISGVVGQCIDSIIAANGSLKIKGELVLEICQNLIVSKTVPLSKVTKVFSIAEAINQCTEWLAKNLPKVTPEYVGSTAVAIKDLERYGKGAAAIGSVFGANLYKRHVLKRDIHDVRNNITHFLILGRSEIRRDAKKNYKTSIIFSVPNHPGALMKVLNVFDAMDINMVKIESRPSKDKLHDYIFWVDIEGHHHDGKIKEALKVIAESKTKFFKNLGSYPKY